MINLQRACQVYADFYLVKQVLTGQVYRNFSSPFHLDSTFGFIACVFDLDGYLRRTDTLRRYFALADRSNRLVRAAPLYGSLAHAGQRWFEGQLLPMAMETLVLLRNMPFFVAAKDVSDIHITHITTANIRDIIFLNLIENPPYELYFYDYST